MAILTNNVLGDTSGKAGEFNYYVRNGKQIKQRLPCKYEHKSPRVKAHRKKFSHVNSFAVTVYHNEVLGNVWQAVSDNKTAAYNKIITLNSKLFENNHPTLDNVITPGGEENTISGILIDSDKLKVTFRQKSPGTLAVIIVAFNSETAHSEYISICQENTESTELDIILDKNTIQKMKAYPEYILFAAIVSNDNGILNWTKTYSSEQKDRV